MILIANVLSALGAVLDVALTFMLFVIIARAIISWVNPDPYNPIVRFLVGASDPIMRPVRRYIPAFGGIDVSPLVVILAIYFLKIALAQSLMDYGAALKAAGRMQGAIFQLLQLA